MARRPSLRAHDGLISILIEGAPGDRGNVRFGAFIAALGAFQKALRSTKDADGRPASAFTVVDLKHSSPATVVLEERPRGGQPPWQGQALLNNLKRVAESDARDVLPSLDVETLFELRGLTKTLSRRVTRLEISTSMGQATIDREFELALEAALGMDDVYRGSVTGRLERVNSHNDLTFYVYPTVGPAKVACDFREDLRKQVADAVDKYVTVHGELRKKRGSRHPHQILAESIRAHPSGAELPTLRDLFGIAPGATGAETSEAFVRRIRRESW